HKNTQDLLQVFNHQITNNKPPTTELLCQQYPTIPRPHHGLHRHHKRRIAPSHITRRCALTPSPAHPQPTPTNTPSSTHAHVHPTHPGDTNRALAHPAPTFPLRKVHPRSHSDAHRDLDHGARLPGRHAAPRAAQGGRTEPERAVQAWRCAGCERGTGGVFERVCRDCRTVGAG
ncbi:uncharacterized protein K452DRAFT_358874, partial [Aplosporella prunicola CBS 121167]